MINNIYILTSRVEAQKARMDAVADNVANVNTPGFKKLQNDYTQEVSRKSGQEVGTFTKGLGTRLDLTPGAMTHTGNPLDVAIVGEAFFGVDRGDGETLFTRAGNFTLDTAGQLVNQQGQAVLDANEAPINIPLETKRIEISPDGTISTDLGEVARLGTFKFEDDDADKLSRAGFGLYAKPRSVEALPTDVAEVQVMQGSIENSNVQSVQEVTNMIEVSRAYESALRAIQRLEELDSRGVRELARMPQ